MRDCPAVACRAGGPGRDFAHDVGVHVPVQAKGHRVAGIDSPAQRKAAVSILMILWFSALSLAHGMDLLRRGAFAVDATIYYRAAANWLAGLDPWAASVAVGTDVYHFAGLPTSLVPIVPIALLPETVGVGLMMMATWVSAFAILRALRLPIWWMLFPPLVEGLISGNPQIALLACLVTSRPALTGLAAVLKIYAVVPPIVLGRWRSVAGALIGLGAAAIVTAPLWPDYISRIGEINQRLADEAVGGYSAYPMPELMLLTALSLGVLWLLDRDRAAWLAGPALWPASQLHYSTLALPIITAPLAAVLALPVRMVPALVTCALALYVGARWLLRGRPPIQLRYGPSAAAKAGKVDPG
jgi:hypothetical protein